MDLAPAGTTAQRFRLLLPGTYHHASHMTLQRSGYCFWGLIITPPTQHFRDIHHYKYDIIHVSISFPHPVVSWVLYYSLSGDNVHSEFTVIQYPWLVNYGDQHEYIIRSLPVPGVHEYKNSGAQEFTSTGVQEYLMSGSSIIIMLSPRKSDNHE